MRKNVKIITFLTVILLALMFVNTASAVTPANIELFSSVSSSQSQHTSTQITEDKHININAENNEIQKQNSIADESANGFKNSNSTDSVIRNNVVLTVDPVEGVVGEDISLKAHVKDNAGNLITGGNLVFKLNGKTFRSDGRFDSNATPWKFSVNNGLVNITIKADLYLRNAKNLTASFSGTEKYSEAKSDVVTAQIRKRNAQIQVNVNPKIQKQYETITLTATVKDVTPNHKNNTIITENNQVLFKLNNETLKDNNGIVKVNVNRKGVATYNYTIPGGIGGITKEGQIRNYTIEAVFVSDTFYPNTRNNTVFNVERCPITINMEQVKVNKNKKLNIQGSIKDIKNNIVKGKNIAAVKINGKTYKDPSTGQVQYFEITNGRINLNNILVGNTTVKRVMIVTGARQAYLGERNETTNIVVE